MGFGEFSISLDDNRKEFFSGQNVTGSIVVNILRNPEIVKGIRWLYLPITN